MSTQKNKVNVSIDSVTVILTYGTDIVSIELAGSTSGVWPFTGPASFKTEIAKNKGVDWVKNYFGVEPKVINARI